MANRPILIPQDPMQTTMFVTAIRDDLKRKQELLSAACRCLEDERSYRFFCHLSSLSEMNIERKEQLLDQLDMMGEYKSYEMDAIRRLVLGDGAVAFKDLVDLVRDIRVEQEIDAMLR